VKDTTALNSLLSALQDKDPSVVAAAVSALGEFDAPEAVQPAMNALATDTLAPEVRHELLTRLAAHAADPQSAYATWATTGTELKQTDLEFLVSIAPTAPATMRPGLIALATRYLDSQQPEARKCAGSILVNYAEDAAIRKLLLDAVEKNAAGVAQAAADVLRKLRGDSVIDVPLMAYYKALCEGAGGPDIGVMPGRAPAPPPLGAVAAAPQAPPYPGLTKAAPADSLVLRQAIIEALGAIGGDRAARALKVLADMDRKRNKDEMAPYFIAAFESCKAAPGVRSLADLYLDRLYMDTPGNHAAEAIAALMNIAALDPEHATDALRRVAAARATPPEIAAAAADARETIPAPSGE
jgi:HEAT repeat protein